MVARIAVAAAHEEMHALDWPTFFSTNIKSLAWPVAAIVALFVLKRHLIELLRALGNRLEKAKDPGFELTFGKGVDQVEEELPSPEVKTIVGLIDPKRIESVSGFVAVAAVLYRFSGVAST